jgi:phage shock protein C
MNEKKLTRAQDDQMLTGVSSGLARYLGIDPVLVRLFFILLTLSTGYGLVFYILLAILMPLDGQPLSAKANAFDSEEIVIKDL